MRTSPRGVPREVLASPRRRSSIRLPVSRECGTEAWRPRHSSIDSSASEAAGPYCNFRSISQALRVGSPPEQQRRRARNRGRSSRQRSAAGLQLVVLGRPSEDDHREDRSHAKAEARHDGEPTDRVDLGCVARVSNPRSYGECGGSACSRVSARELPADRRLEDGALLLRDMLEEFELFKSRYADHLAEWYADHLAELWPLSEASTTSSGSIGGNGTWARSKPATGSIPVGFTSPADLRAD
jgi:hypothetical protein